jgi:hypothetical protein
MKQDRGVKPLTLDSIKKRLTLIKNQCRI